MRCQSKSELDVREDGQDDTGDRPMLWALHAQSGRVTHISHLSREQKGLACDCVCYACKTPLQAVNAGQNASYFLKPNARGQFFRHSSGYQRDECLQSAARMAALDLFMRLEEIDLPAPRVRRQVVGISGRVFEHTQMGNRVHARVTSRRWIDEQKAQITLDNGKVILIKLVTDTVVAEGSEYDAVINIQVNDPAVASWTPEQLLERMELVDEWVSWDRSWQDNELAHQADLKARTQAIEALEIESDGEIVLPPGLEAWQKSESLLHYVVKSILAEIGRIRVPGLKDKLVKEMPDGKVETLTVEIKPTTLAIKNARLERRLDDTVPDVICTAVDQHTGLGSFDLLIEVAVTHPVDSIKAGKIRDAGIACVEVDVSLINVQRRCTRTDLFEAIGRDASNKRWIHLPAFHNRLAEADGQLKVRARSIQAVLEHRQRLESWAQQRSVTELGELYKRALKRRWGSPNTDWRLVRIDHQGLSWTLGELADCLKVKGCAGVDDPLMIEQGGILWYLARIDDSSLRKGQPFDMWRVLQVMNQDSTLRQFVGLMAMAARVYRADYSEQSDQVEELLKVARGSLKRGEEIYARPDTFDTVIQAAFPALAEALRVPAGTLKRVQELRRQKFLQDEELRRRILEKEESIRIAKKWAMLEEEERLGAMRWVEKVAARGWMPRTSLSNSIEQCQRHLRGAPALLAWRQRDPDTLVALAHRARDLKIPLKTWLLELQPTSGRDVEMIAKILSKAWLLDDTDPMPKTTKEPR